MITLILADRSPLDLARALAWVASNYGHLMTNKEAAEIGIVLHQVYVGQHQMPRKGTQRHFDTLVLERIGDEHYLRIKGAREPLLLIDNDEWLHGSIHLYNSSHDRDEQV